MFVVKKEESFNKTIRMPGSMIKQMEKIASKEDISFNKLVVHCCKYALEHIDMEQYKDKDTDKN